MEGVAEVDEGVVCQCVILSLVGRGQNLVTRNGQIHFCCEGWRIEVQLQSARFWCRVGYQFVLHHSNSVMGRLEM